MNVYVFDNAEKAEDGRYHCYIIKDKENRFWEHYEKKDTPDGSWRKCGDYMVMPQIFETYRVREVSSSECASIMLDI